MAVIKETTTTINADKNESEERTLNTANGNTN